MLWREFDRYDSSRPFGAWARGVAAKTILRGLRQTRQLPTTLSPAAIEALELAFAAFERSESEEEEALRHCLDRLPDRSRDLVHLRYRKIAGVVHSLADHEQHRGRPEGPDRVPRCPQVRRAPITSRCGGDRILARARQIIPRCLDGVATDAEIAELDRLLAEHSNVARELARAARLESGLETVLRPPDLSDVAARGMAVSTAATEVERAPIPRPRVRRIIVTASATLAVAAAALLVWSLRGSPRDLGIQSQTTVRSDLPEKRRFSDGSLAELRTPDSQIETRSVRSEGGLRRLAGEPLVSRW